MAAKKTFSKLLKVLDSAGFIHKGLGNSQYALGPAGTLLQHNIVHTWLVCFYWESRVSTFTRFKVCIYI